MHVCPSSDNSGLQLKYIIYNQSMSDAIQLIFKVRKSLAPLTARCQNSYTFKDLRWFGNFSQTFISFYLQKIADEKNTNFKRTQEWKPEVVHNQVCVVTTWLDDNCVSMCSALCSSWDFSRVKFCADSPKVLQIKPFV